MIKSSEQINGQQFDVAIVGGGLGGLQCGYILSKNGLKVCVLEKNPIPGGCLQSFFRKGADEVVEFDSGLHYVGGLDAGQPLNALFSYFNLMHLPWQKMDAEAFDEVNINGKSYLYANGHKEFAERMTDYFPAQKENIGKYVSLLKEVGESLPKSLSPKSSEDVYTGSLFARSAHEFLCETITDPLLREVLSGTSLKMELGHNLPLYTFAQINNSFIESAYRLNGGGNLIWQSLVESIESMGGTVVVNSKVTEICGTKVTINGEHTVNAKNVISNLHPAATMAIIGEEAGLRKVYKNRISRLPNTFGMFTANIALKENSVKYLNRNQYIHKLDAGCSLWDAARQSGKREVSSLLVSYYNTPCNSLQSSGSVEYGNCNAESLKGGNNLSGYKKENLLESKNRYANRIDLLTPMDWSEVEAFENSKLGVRDEAYYALKEEKLQECLKLAQTLVPELDGAIEKVYTSSPLTYRDYTATACGSAYGIRKDYSNLMLTLLTPKTPLENLFLTGQCLNLHGVLGVSMTSFFTCAHIIGMENAVKGLEF